MFVWRGHVSLHPTLPPPPPPTNTHNDAQLAATDTQLQAASEARAASQRQLAQLSAERGQLAGELAQEKRANEALRAEGARLERAKGEEVRW